MSKYSISKKVGSDFDAAVESVRSALETDCFGIIDDLDMSGMFRQRLGKEFRKYRVLSVCHAQLVHKAVTVETEAGLLLPLHIVIYENDEGGATVAAVDPVVVMSMIENPALAIIAREIREKLARIIGEIS